MALNKGAEYLERAQECREKALAVQTETERERWLRMAAEWERLAEQYYPGASGDWIRSQASAGANGGHPKGRRADPDEDGGTKD